MSDSPHGPDPLAPPTLEYGRPQAAMRSGWQWCLGILLGAVPTLAAAVGVPFLFGVGGFVLGPLLAGAAMFFVGLRLRRGTDYRPMAAGVWTGIGVAVLIDGICVAGLLGIR